ncbi:MAG TPA: adenylyl-sulfate kinase [Candidatus Angelobacter sp.]|nr:adenylyl-sulfate kinase [Candidatus Angelobacter sp.]
MIPEACQKPRDLLRFLTAGSVDDGKSTLIGRLLHDSGGIYEDELAALSRKSSAHGRSFDPSLLTDGLKAEREQGITIDVAYRYFSTARREFIIADSPGHDQYTRNMVTGASTAQAAVLLIDVRHGILPQTRRHAYIASLLGIQVVIVAVNKMDLVGFDADIFHRLRKDYLEFSASLRVRELHFIPVCALEGDNVTAKSPRIPWYEGMPLLQVLEMVEVADDRISKHFRLPVQTVIRGESGFRGYAGQVASGRIGTGDEVVVLPSRLPARISQITNYRLQMEEAHAPMSVAITLREQMDIGRGDMLCDPEHSPVSTRQFRAKLIWMSELPMRSNQPYLIRHTTQTACMSILKVLHKVDIHTFAEVEAGSLVLNEIGEVEIQTHKPIFCDSYSSNRTTGSFIVVDPIHNTTLAAGIIMEPSVEDPNSDPSSLALPNRGPEDRGLTVWITGLSGAGKTTICEAVHTELLARGHRVEMLDGDVIRKHLSRELGFSKVERDENIRRIGFVANLLTRNGVVALVSAISPYRAVRDEIRQEISGFLEVFVNAPLNVCERRDPKGLYKRARSGEFRGFTGIDDPYEPPLSPDVECKTDSETVKESVDKVVAAILKVLS